ncbi:transcription factor bHLH51-like [Lolium perenne]|uniref:transcription factor bHLH51-like n=1 Tax=Lolium perenne TaxID=4522 RepID=UPI0021EA4C83|nr:transcription factor bHLH30-like [Lolium perenne]
MNCGPFSGAAGLYEGFYGGFGGGHGHDHGFNQQLEASTLSALFDGGTRQLHTAVDVTDVVQKRKGGGERDEKAATALRSHSEAERRRRERINAHLATLRSMVPCTDKMDKAALLAEVINHVKKLKAEAARIGKHCPVPSGADEVTVVEVVQQSPSPHATTTRHNGPVLLVKATLSCADSCADLFADVRRALQPLKPRVVGSEVTTLGGRVGLTVLMTREGAVTAASVRQALESVLDRVVSSAAALDFAPRDSLLYSKRRRVSTFESSSSSS